MSGRARCWIFTFNNYTEQDEQNVQTFIREHTRYGVYGRETAPTTGTKHLQGYIEFDKPWRMGAIKKQIHPSIHLETRRGSREQAIDYTKKDGDIFEFGTEELCKGRRTDLDSYRTIALEKGLRAVSMHASLQEIKVAESFLTWNETGREWKPHVYWYHGKTGLGKSRKARFTLTNECGLAKEDVYTKSDGTKWWPGYDGQAGVIIDDFRPSWWNITEMLSLLDRYEKRIEYKGGYRQFRARFIVVTSCLSPRECYTNTGESIEQLIRRLDTVEHFVFEWMPPSTPNGGEMGSDLQPYARSPNYQTGTLLDLNLSLEELNKENEFDFMDKTQPWTCDLNLLNSPY